MEKQIIDIYNSLQELAWHFGDHGINGKCCEDLSFVEFMALKKIYENEEITIQEIGFNLNFTKSGATKIINRIEKKGYVIRKSSPLDGRVCCVCVTENGVKVITKIIKKYTAYIQEILSDLDTDTVKEIKTTLETLSNLAQNHEMI